MRERERERRRGNRRESMMIIMRGKDGASVKALKKEEENRNGAGTPRRSPGCTGGRQTRPARFIRLHIKSSHLDSLFHVALRRGGHPVRLCYWLSPAKLTKLKQETSSSEPTSLRPLQAQKKSVSFSASLLSLYAHILTFTFGLR
jgi:hypothetical protein